MNYQYQGVMGIDNAYAADAYSLALAIPENRRPVGLEHSLWREQAEIYKFNWYFWRGQVFDEATGKDSKTGKYIYKYPLRISLLHQICRIHNSVLWGEVRDYQAPVKTRVRPSVDYTTGKPLESQKTKAAAMERIVEKVWAQSSGAALLWECGLVNQFLGGSYLQMTYEPERVDSGETDIPIFIRALKPDFVLPVPNPRDPWELLECFVVYRINPASARALYGIEAPRNATYVTYVEHWTKDDYSILIDGSPLMETKVIAGTNFTTQTTFDRLPNPFGFVPIVYIPRMREGSFYGKSITGDIAGLITEYNSRMADIGDQVAQAADTEWFGRNLGKDPVYKPFGNGRRLNDIGYRNPSIQADPEVWAEPSPAVTQPALDYNASLLAQIDREAALSPVTFGIDEGSQRSGTTLQVRFAPTIAAARAQRVHWGTALTIITRFMLRAVLVKGLMPDGVDFTIEDVVKVLITHRWAPYIPKDESDTVNRIVLLKQAGAMSKRRAVAEQSDVEDVDEELGLIDEDTEEAMEQQKQMEQAKQQLDEPVAEPDSPD